VTRWDRTSLDELFNACTGVSVPLVADADGFETLPPEPFQGVAPPPNTHAEQAQHIVAGEELGGVILVEEFVFHAFHGVPRRNELQKQVTRSSRSIPLARGIPPTRKDEVTISLVRSASRIREPATP